MLKSVKMLSKRALISAAVVASLSLGVTSFTTSAEAAAVFKSADTSLNLEVSTGTLIRLDKPAANVFIADPEVADVHVKSPRLVYVFGKKPGTTTLYAVTGNDDVIFSGAINVTHNLGQLKAALHQMSPETAIDVNEMNGVLVLTGTVKSPEEASDVHTLANTLAGKDQQIVNRLSIATPTQVNLRVRIAEVSRDVTKQLGFNWEGMVGVGKSSFGLLNASDVFSYLTKEQLEVINQLPLAMKPTRNFLTSGKDSGSYVGSLITGKVDLNALVDALDMEGFLTVLAEPNLTALSGEHASFLAGGEFPIPVPQENGVITIDYRQFGVGLKFTPTVLGQNKINLKVSPEVSQLSTSGSITLNGFNIPALTTRRADTTVELASGQSFAIAGLLQNDIDRELQKFPGLGDIPVLGALFRSDRFQRRETELLIIVTPYIVRPVSGKKMLLPTDGLVMPNDKERYLDGQTYRAVPQDTTPATLDTSGRPTVTPAGFMLN